ncbi:hypothetical protein OBBRIDRAFT_85650 [Obba rivulosa]|uniref:Uncharacterized protein n=1 Tax=Obba rivulosa TaxID=1052685 RepID=A0A8E2APH8_9APHY|nr:hypothetical protein OBBRIDRAFT_85650 [Obba rivulosa]
MTETDLRLLSRNAVAYETYAKQLFFLGFGLPLWTPEERMEAGDVLLGDVGILQDGSFHRLFNARLPLQHSLNTCYGTPDASLSSYFSLMPQHKYDVDSISPCVIYSQSTQLMAQNTIELHMRGSPLGQVVKKRSPFPNLQAPSSYITSS